MEIFDFHDFRYSCMELKHFNNFIVSHEILSHDFHKSQMIFQDLQDFRYSLMEF